jgi:large subunit ribosomal protein L30
MSALKITQVRSANGATGKQRDALRSLGLCKIGRSVERPDHPTLRGTLRVVNHLVKVEQ